MAAQKGNRFNEKYPLPEWKRIFEEMVEDAYNNEDVLCVQDLFVKRKISSSTFYDLCKKHKELESLKEDMQNIIVARINRGGLLSLYNPTMSIWRMKQLGEVDRQDINQHHSGAIASEHQVTFKNYQKK
jgi:hypothetical protein